MSGTMLQPAAAPAVLTVKNGDVNLRVYDYGNPTAPAMILVHGIQDLALSLTRLAIAFSPRYHVLSFDLRGHGDSDKPGIYTLAHFQADLHAVIAQLDVERPVLVGHSLGGQIVAHYAAVFSEVPSRLISIEGLGPPLNDLDLQPAQRRQRARDGIESLLRPQPRQRPLTDLEEAARVFARIHSRLHSGDVRRLVALGTEPHPDGGLRWKWDPRVHTTWLSVSHRANEERWGWIECPVLLVTAGHASDFWRRRRGVDAVAATIDRAELERRVRLFRLATHVEIAGAGHMVHYDAPSELIAAMDTFLAGSGEPVPPAGHVDPG